MRFNVTEPFLPPGDVRAVGKRQWTRPTRVSGTLVGTNGHAGRAIPDDDDPRRSLVYGVTARQLLPSFWSRLFPLKINA